MLSSYSIICASHLFLFLQVTLFLKVTEKRNKLLSEMECLKSVCAPIASEYTSPSSVANSLSHTEIHKNLMEIFHQKTPLSTAALFDPSAVPTKAVHGQKKSLKLARSLSGEGQMTPQ